jgi:hypothetical protein
MLLTIFTKYPIILIGIIIYREGCKDENYKP